MAKLYKGKRPKVAIDPGHGGADPGAVKYIREKDANLAVGLACRDLLNIHDVDTWMSRTSDKDTDLNTTCNKINEWGADLAISCHKNAGGGDGFEVIHSIVGGVGKTLAKNIEAEVLKLGQNSRGLKTRKNSSGSDYFAFNRLTNCPAVICEGAFVDNKVDVKIIDTVHEQELFGYAYAKGALKTLGIKIKTVYELLDTMNFRELPSLEKNVEILNKIPAGTLLTGRVDKNGWLKTTYNGKTGYVRIKSPKSTYGRKV